MPPTAVAFAVRAPSPNTAALNVVPDLLDLCLAPAQQCLPRARCGYARDLELILLLKLSQGLHGLLVQVPVDRTGIQALSFQLLLDLRDEPHAIRIVEAAIQAEEQLAFLAGRPRVPRREAFPSPNPNILWVQLVNVTL